MRERSPDAWLDGEGAYMRMREKGSGFKGPGARVKR